MTARLGGIHEAKHVYPEAARAIAACAQGGVSEQSDG